MVLSNKKLKQRLRAIKTALLADSEVQIHQHEGNSTNPEKPTSVLQESLKSLLDSVAHKPRLSKRKKLREKSLPLQESAEILKNGNLGKREVESQTVLEDNNDNNKKKKKKRKRGDENGLGTEEVKNVTEKKKKAKKRKKNEKKKKLKNAQVNESLENGNAESIGQVQVLEQKTKFDGSSEVCTKVYVGGIPFYSTEDDIRSYFDSCGTITEIDCMTFPESGKFRGIAILGFKTEAAAKRALALDGSDMGGLFLKIQPYKSNRVSKNSTFSPGMVEGYNKIYVGNLSWDITEDDLRNLFQGCNIASLRFGEDKETGEFRGYAHVDFSDSVSLNTALKLDQKIVCGRPVRISCAVPRKGSGNKIQTPVQIETVSKTEEPPTEIKAAGAGAGSDAVAVPAVSGKIRRRTCYECGERGHLSSSCPKKQESAETNINAS